MTLESIMNFEKDQIVMFNPDNHGFKLVGAYSKRANRKGVVLLVDVKGKIDNEGQFKYVRTGRITVRWEHQIIESSIHHYSRLKIM